jgi:hypothetical protein
MGVYQLPSLCDVRFEKNFKISMYKFSPSTEKLFILLVYMKHYMFRPQWVELENLRGYHVPHTTTTTPTINSATKDDKNESEIIIK